MILRLGQWFALALTSALVLSACAARTGSTMPSAPGFGAAASIGQSVPDLRIINLNALPNAAKCPMKKFTGGCQKVSKSKGLELGWCYTTHSKKENDACTNSNAGAATWTGVICAAKGSTCKKATKVMTAKFTGPYSCKKYKAGCKGTFELDAISPGPGLKTTPHYLYKQAVKACGTPGCITKYVGLSVGP
jgi:hypothetical protein